MEGQFWLHETRRYLHGYSIKRLLAPWTDTADLPQLKLRIHRAQRNLYGTIPRSPLDNLSRLAITFSRTRVYIFLWHWSAYSTDCIHVERVKLYLSLDQRLRQLHKSIVHTSCKSARDQCLARPRYNPWATRTSTDRAWRCLTSRLSCIDRSSGWARLS